jgi:peptide/nickel transport system permease protein
VLENDWERLAAVTRRPWIRAALAQLGWAVVTLWVISVIVFAGTNLRSPESVARQALGRTTEAQVETFVKEQGLDRSTPVRYFDWLGGFAQGDWGRSIGTQEEVQPEIVSRLGRSLLLALIALAISVPISLLCGVYMARRVGRASDFGLLTSLVVVSALPEFVIGLVLVTVFAVQLGWLPVDSTAIAFGTPSQKAQAYVLPVLTLVIAVVPYMARVSRAAIAETLTSGYSRAGLLRGLSPRRVLWDYSVRNASVPILNAVALNFVYLLGGVLVVENVFGFPGIGQLLVQAIQRTDVVTVQAASLLLGAFVVATNIITDLLVIYFTPRMRGRTP